MTYAELIQRAIETSPDKKLTLSQIYDWFINYVPYFKNKIDQESSFGWKNSIRHNLSLHKKFARVQNTEYSKSSWWTLSTNNVTVKSESVVEEALINEMKILEHPPQYMTSSSVTSYESSTNSGEEIFDSNCTLCNSSNECLCVSFNILNEKPYHREGHFEWNLDINEIICHERTLNGGVLDFNKEMFSFIEHNKQLMKPFEN